MLSPLVQLPTVANALLAPRQDLAAGPPKPAQPPAGAFAWGAGGQRLTSEELANRRAIAQSLMKSNYSPVQNIWQGLGRVADNWLGAIDERKLDKQSDAATSRSNAVAQALMSGKPDLQTATMAATDQYVSPEVQKLGNFWMERLAPKASTAQPYRFEDNAGNQWELDPATGQPKLIFTDRAPKQIVADGQLITSTNPYLDSSSAAPGALPGPKPGDVVDDPRLAIPGGPTLPASGTFHP